jgi:hypothetical protein
MNLFKKAYDWASTYDFEDIDIEYASKLALKMLDDSCQMNSHDREVFSISTMPFVIEPI